MKEKHLPILGAALIVIIVIVSIFSGYVLFSIITRASQEPAPVVVPPNDRTGVILSVVNWTFNGTIAMVTFRLHNYNTITETAVVGLIINGEVTSRAFTVVANSDADGSLSAEAPNPSVRSIQLLSVTP